jgi:hypothetical protein
MGELVARQYRKACNGLLYNKQVDKKMMDSIFAAYGQKLSYMHDFYDSTIKSEDYMQPALLEQVAKDLHALRAYERTGKGLLKY